MVDRDGQNGRHKESQSKTVWEREGGKEMEKEGITYAGKGLLFTWQTHS